MAFVDYNLASSVVQDIVHKILFQNLEIFVELLFPYSFFRPQLRISVSGSCGIRITMDPVFPLVENRPFCALFV